MKAPSKNSLEAVIKNKNQQSNVVNLGDKVK